MDPREQRHADARLIAAAPELLAACIEAEAALAGLDCDYDGTAQALDLIRRAIERARS
jgi:hypothetical protein